MPDVLTTLCHNLAVLYSDVHVVSQIHDTVLLLINKPLGFCLSINYIHLTYATVGKLLYLKTTINFRSIPKIRVASSNVTLHP